MNYSSDSRANPPFRPTLRGCVARNPQLARAFSGIYQHTLYEVAAMTYRSLIAETTDHGAARLFDEIAIDAAEHFRLLGDLILALGADPCIQVNLCVEHAPRQKSAFSNFVIQMISDAKQEKKRSIDRLQTIMGKSADRVVRSVLSHLLDDESRHLAALEAFS